LAQGVVVRRVNVNDGSSYDPGNVSNVVKLGVPGFKPEGIASY